MTHLSKFFKDQTQLERLLNSFEFSHETGKVISNMEKAALYYADSVEFSTSSAREQDTFILHIQSLIDLLHHIRVLEEELNKR